MSRVEALLTTRLEDLSQVFECQGAPAGEARRLLELASVATSRAVALELLSAERAETIWRTAKERHPLLAEAERGLPRRLAA